MRIVFTTNGWEENVFWHSSDHSTVKRINRLLADITRDPFAGIGKPEQLGHALAEAWSRRIDEEHPLVYLVEGDDVVVLQARYHFLASPPRNSLVAMPPRSPSSVTCSNPSSSVNSSSRLPGMTTSIKSDIGGPAPVPRSTLSSRPLTATSSRSK